MTGPEHYRRAEALLESCQLPGRNDKAADGTPIENYPALEDRGEGPEDTVGHALAAAQVHATLALAAARAESIAQGFDGPDDTTIPMAWSAAIS